MKQTSVDAPAAGAAGTVVSRDGTNIAFRRFGQGPSMILVGGAFNDMNAPAAGVPLARLLSRSFTVFAYDRRGRGASGDTPPYAVEREVDDLAALIDEAGGKAFAYGMSSGGALVLAAAARGLAIARLALYEPPFSMDGAAEERAQAYAAALAEALGAGRRGDAVALFMAHVGIESEQIARMRHAPMWPGLEALAPTLAYNSAVMRDATGATVPSALLAGIKAPGLVISGGASPAWMRTVGEAVAGALPGGSYAVLDGQTHDVGIEALARVLRDFFAS